MIKRKKKSQEEIEKNLQDINAQNEFFLKIWKKRKHYCESCGIWLGYEPRTYMFDHLLEKNKYADLRFEENNIFLCCFECHGLKTNGFVTEKHAIAINKVKNEYGYT